MTEVRCTVDSCKFWGMGDVCKADLIWVKNNLRGDAGIEIATEWGEAKSSRKSAQTSDQTCCETMRPRQ